MMLSYSMPTTLLLAGCCSVWSVCCMSSFHPFAMQQQVTPVASALPPTTTHDVQVYHTCGCETACPNSAFVASCHFTKMKRKHKTAPCSVDLLSLQTQHSPAVCRWRWMVVMPSPSLGAPPSEAAQPVAASGTPRSSQMMKLKRMCALNSALLLCLASLAMHALQVGIHLHFWCTCAYVKA